MNIYYLSEQPVPDSLGVLPLLPDTPPYLVDAVILIGTPPDTHDQLATLRQYGRPVMTVEAPLTAEKLSDVTTQLTDADRTNYQPIDCNFYDNFEIAIMRRTQVQLQFKGAKGVTRHRNTRLLDTRTHRTEEYVQLEDKSWLRLDQIEIVDGVPAGSSCRF